MCRIRTEREDRQIAREPISTIHLQCSVLELECHRFRFWMELHQRTRMAVDSVLLAEGAEGQNVLSDRFNWLPQNYINIVKLICLQKGLIPKSLNHCATVLFSVIVNPTKRCIINIWVSGVGGWPGSQCETSCYQKLFWGAKLYKDKDYKGVLRINSQDCLHNLFSICGCSIKVYVYSLFSSVISFKNIINLKLAILN